MNNPARGEIALVLEGYTYALRPTLDAMLRVEKVVGKSVFHLVMHLGNPATLTLDNALSVVEIGLRAGPDAGRLPKSAQLREQLYSLGLPELIQVCAKFLSGSVGDGEEPTEPDEPGETKAAAGNG